MKKTYPLSEVYRLLEPGPVVMVSTRRKGRNNIQTMAWYTMMEFTPPIVGCIIAGEVTSEFLKASRECVLNIPTRDMAKKMVQCGSVSGREVDKFEKFGLTPAASGKVAPPRIEECFANLECRVVRGTPKSLLSRYGFFVLEVVKAWIDPAVKRPKTIHHRGKGEFYVPGASFRMPFKAGK